MVKRIFVVDDEQDICFALGSYENPIVALEKFNADLYDLIVLDIKMSDLNGFSLYRKIKGLDQKVKICFLTGGEMYYGVYLYIFSSVPVNCFIRKAIDNELMKLSSS
jgi:two-component SAPR family response regulator